MDLSYKENLDKLQVRIRAHKEFANFDIGDWIAEYVGRAPRRAIFDLGCGNGNHLGIYLEGVGASGTVAGLDREARLIDEARGKYAGARQPRPQSRVDGRPASVSGWRIRPVFLEFRHLQRGQSTRDD
jgi:SAM-dependent methyltransferase